MAKAKTTQLSLAYLRAAGWTAIIVERWNQWAKVRQDFAGFADILAFHPERQGVLAVQTTTHDHRYERMFKICAEPRAVIWAQAGNSIEVHGWKKEKNKWKPTVIPVRLKDQADQISTPLPASSKRPRRQRITSPSQSVASVSTTR